ncbi:MAG: AAA family ATPase [Prosthecochloris sp.]|nr:AAA family ATPase [Prosthecochloris sp.]
MKWMDELLLDIAARIAVIQIVSPDEEDIMQSMAHISRSRLLPEGTGMFSWDIAAQFSELCPPDTPFQNRTATYESVLGIIAGYQGRAVFILKDFHHAWQHRSQVLRMLRNLASELPSRTNPLTIILTSPEDNLPSELRHDIPLIETGNPGPERLHELLLRTAGPVNALEHAPSGLVQRLVESALGLSLSEAGRAYRKALVRCGPHGLDERAVRMVTHEKQHIIRNSGALELYPFTGSMVNVGGLGTLKTWLDERHDAFSADARDYGLTIPGGVALIGIPGTGKSLCAKVTAGHWGMPLLRMDVGALFSGLLGSSEQNVRKAIRIAEVIAPCVLWVDEIEKAFAGSEGDSGTASRVLATFLTWMQEKTVPVFVFATANKIHRLPPELLRKGRFDEIFFLDLPTHHERMGILEVHLRNHGYTMVPQRFDLEKAAAETEGFVGAELQAVVNEAMFPAFRDNRRELETADLLKAAAGMVPLARSHRAHIEELRRMVDNGQARNASDDMKENHVSLDRIAQQQT